MQGDISNAYGSTDRLAVLKAARRHVPSFAPMVRVADCDRRNGGSDTSEGPNGGTHDVPAGVWPGKHIEQCNFPLDILEQNDRRSKRERPTADFTSYADDFLLSTEEDARRECAG